MKVDRPHRRPMGHVGSSQWRRLNYDADRRKALMEGVNKPGGASGSLIEALMDIEELEGRVKHLLRLVPIAGLIARVGERTPQSFADDVPINCTPTAKYLKLGECRKAAKEFRDVLRHVPKGGRQDKG